MALLQTTLNLVEVGVVETVAVVTVVGSDDVSFCCFLARAALEVFVIKAGCAWFILLLRRHFLQATAEKTCKLVGVSVGLRRGREEGMGWWREGGARPREVRMKNHMAAFKEF